MIEPASRVHPQIHERLRKHGLEEIVTGTSSAERLESENKFSSKNQNHHIFPNQLCDRYNSIPITQTDTNARAWLLW